MATVSNRRMLVHTRSSEGWTSEEFASISDAMRTLRGRGLHFTDENVFFHPESYGVIVSDSLLVEVEECAYDDGILPFKGKDYLILKEWVKREGASIWSVREAMYSGNLPFIKVGRLGLIYVLAEMSWNGKVRNGKYSVNGKRYLSPSAWAKMNGISISTVKRGISDGRIPYRWHGKRILIDEDMRWEDCNAKR